MLSLIVTIMFALAIAYFAIQNTLGVTLVVANNIFTNVPLFAIVIGSVLLGVLMSSVISGLNTLSTYLTIRSKEHIIHEDAKAIHSLQNKVQQLEVENARLRTDEQEVNNRTIAAEETHAVHDAPIDESHPERETAEELRPVQRHSFFYNLFHPRHRTV